MRTEKNILNTLAILAALLLAACANDSVVREILHEPDVPKVISFSSYSEKATRGDGGDDTKITNLEYYHNTFAVLASKKDQDGYIQYVFGDTATKLGTTCTYTGNATASFYNSNWSYVDERYWDRYADYNFIAYAPSDPTAHPLRYTLGIAQEIGTIGTSGRDFTAPHYYLTGKNLQAYPTAAPINKGFNQKGQDLDLMTSDLVSRPGTNKNQVDLSFKHILSKLNISVCKTAVLNDATVMIDSIIITGLRDQASYMESRYDLDNSISGWQLDDQIHDSCYTLAYRFEVGNHDLPNADTDPARVNPLYFIESLVMPQPVVADSARIFMCYKIISGNTSETYRYKVYLHDIFTEFMDRKSYTIQFTIDPRVILFDASVYEWAGRSYTLTP